MKTFPQLAESAYTAYRKKAIEHDRRTPAGYANQWDELDVVTQACWVAAVQQVAAEIAAIH